MPLPEAGTSHGIYLNGATIMTTPTARCIEISRAGGFDGVEVRAERLLGAPDELGEAFSDGQTSGVWVYSVQSGSPADKAGVRGGDIITAMEGLPLGTDGTVQDYCDILRSRESTDVMAIEVLRHATQEVLEGQLNGRELKTSFSFAQELEGEVQQEAGEPTGYAEYVSVYDDSEAIGMEIPAEWSGGEGTTFIVLAAVPAQRQFVMVVQVQVVSDADLEALDTILNTFQVVGDL